MTHRKLRLMLILCVTALLLPACDKPKQEKEKPSIQEKEKPSIAANDPLLNPASLFEPAPADPAAIAQDDTLVITLNGSPNTLNPIFVSSTYDFIVNDLVFDSLFTFDAKFKLSPNEALVESVTVSEDKATATVKLKPGLKWQDGKPLTAHDVVFTWAAILDPMVPALAQRHSLESIKECVALDDLTIKYVQPEKPATWDWNLLFPIIPKHLYEAQRSSSPDLRSGPYYNNLARNPIGNGRYRVVQWKENDRVILERWDDYPGKKPYFKRIIAAIIPNPQVALQLLQKGELDSMDRIAPQMFVKDTQTDEFKRIALKGRAQEWSFNYIGWNMDGSNPFFNDKRVRYAMTHALNLPLILDQVFFNLATQAHGIYHPDSWMYNPNVKLLKYDVAKAAALLDEAGWTVDPNDGWRYKTIKDVKTKFEFTLSMPEGSMTSPKVAAIFQQDLKKLGIIMNIQSLEWSVFLERAQKHNFQANIAAWGTGTDPDQSGNLWKSSEYTNGRNYGGYKNPRIDELFEKGRFEHDREKRRAIYQEIHSTLYEDQPYTWISNPPILAFFHKRIQGVGFSPRGIYNFTPGLDSWWAAKGNSRDVMMP